IQLRLACGDPAQGLARQVGRRELAGAQPPRRLGNGQLVEHGVGARHSMILGTRKKSPSRAGALASKVSALGVLVTTSSRHGAVKSSTCAVGSTAEVSSSFSFST